GSNRTTVLVVADRAGSSGAYSLDNAAMLVASSGEYVGNLGAGTFNQIGGTNQVGSYFGLGLAAGASGTYNLMNGSLTVVSGTGNLNTGVFGFDWVGGSGTGVFNQSGGSHSVGADFSLGGKNFSGFGIGS